MFFLSSRNLSLDNAKSPQVAPDVPLLTQLIHVSTFIFKFQSPVGYRDIHPIGLVYGAQMLRIQLS